jgi:hypothetical protein
MEIMTSCKWVLGVVAGGLALGAVGARAAPMPVAKAEVSAPVQTVQFFDDDPPVVYDAPRRYYYDDPPPRRYYGPPRERWERWERRPPRAEYRPGPYGGFWDKEAAKDAVKDYRRTQKEIHKERVRAWNRANGY